MYCEQRHIFFNGKTVDLSARQQADLCARTFSCRDFFLLQSYWLHTLEKVRIRGGGGEKKAEQI